MPEEKNLNCCQTKWPQTILIIVSLVLISAIVIVSILRERLVSQQFKNVTITGQGKISYVPDIAIITLGVQIDKVAKPEEALSQLNQKIEGIIKAVKAVGIEAENIQAQNYYLYPQYDYNKDNVSLVSGYNANEQMVIKVKDYDKNPDRLSQVIVAATKAGANQVANLSFDASNINDLKQQARIKAIADAKEKSASLAAAAGIELKDITGWYENLVNPSSAYATDYGKGGMGSSSVTPQVPAGNREIAIEIGITYNIK